MFDGLTEEHLKAFGQIFNQHDTIDTVYEYSESLSSMFASRRPVINREQIVSGTNRWFILAEQVFNIFGKNNFKIWKNRLLKERMDWSETLDKEEVNALVAAMATLRDNPDYQDIFWALVDTHGNAVGPMRLTEVWYGFAKILDFVEKNNGLQINKRVFLEHLKNKMLDGKFNATNFLYRLNFALNHVAEKSDSQIVQQEILNNIDKIDWRYNAFFYSCKYGKYRFWDESIYINELDSLLSDRISDIYEVPWDTIPSDKINYLIGYALRYAAQRMGLDKRDFNALRDKLLANRALFANNDAPSMKVMRLLLASLAIGIDSIRDLDKKEFTSIDQLMNPAFNDIIEKINALIALDNQDLKKNTYQMRLVDLPIFIDVFRSFKSAFQIKNLPLDLDLINICGHALHCFDKQGKTLRQKQESLAKLLKFALSVRFYHHPLLTAYPWIIDEIQENPNGSFNFTEPFLAHILDLDRELPIFKNQLKSINPKSTTWLPKKEEIFTAVQKIADEGRRTRESIVKQWKAKGCDITDQNARYRPLSDLEVEFVQKHRNLKLSDAYNGWNRPLFDRLVPYLAVCIDRAGDIEPQVTPLLDLLAKLDAKMEYNELGQILGLLLDKAEDSETLSKCYYSIEQLTIWLRTFLNDAEFEQKPYPTEFLKELLNDALNEPESGLLNSSLEYLQERDDSNLRLQSLMNPIIQSKLAFDSQALLVKLAVKLKRDVRAATYVTKITGALKNIDSDKREKYFSILVTNLVNSREFDTSLDDLIELTVKPKYATDNPGLVELYKDNQAKLLEMLAKDNIKFIPESHDDHNHIQDYLNRDSTEKEYYINLILVAALENPRNVVYEKAIFNKLNSWHTQEIKNLAIYYTQLPQPTAMQLATLLNQEIKTTKKVVHEFETKIQASDANGLSKRIYSIDAQDIEDIKRVLDGFKLKGISFISDDEQKDLVNLLYYANTYSKHNDLSNLEFTDLQQELYAELQTSRSTNDPQAVARVLACMREILLRKTGMWANHTQMIDLLYGALHNDESLLHQVKTGEGKSIITLMRTSYRALNGQIVDVFSSKDSLSKRDHAEFKMVFDAFGIRNSYINENSDSKLYNSEIDSRGIGAVNYCTIGNWSLFVSGVFWQNLKNFNLKAKNRVAFIDEGDHVLRDEHTQFNYSDNGDGKTVYNLDEWVYREAYAFYAEHKETFKDYFSGQPSVSRNKEIRLLCERLQQIEKNAAPKNSRFFREFIIPAIHHPNDETLEARDQQLRQLFTAAHVASGLKEDKHYCIMPETRIVSEGVGIDTKFAKVVINNQVYHGSTYSELVQQFLHVRLNYEAVQKGQTPNFFVEPDSEIALSLNAPYIIKNYYAYAEACTGTSGDADDLKVYSEEFNIHRVIKLPTHAEVKTEFLPPIYAGDASFGAEIFEDNEAVADVLKEGQEAQALAIVESILANNQQPILITCEDDNAVRELGGLIQQFLKNETVVAAIALKIKDNAREEAEDFTDTLDAYVDNLKHSGLDTYLEDTHGKKNAKFILDTNASRRSEADVLPFAGRKGSITISSRMGRGTDIKPYDKNVGLRVIRTYPIHPRVVKQEQGRQGRNGANGACQDILNYNEIYLDYLKYSHKDSPYSGKFHARYEFEEEHLNRKLVKHAKLKKQNKLIWAHIASNADAKKQYLITRTLQHLKLNINREVNKFIRRKEDLQAILSGHVISILPKLSERDREDFKVAWRKARRKINAAWNRRLANKTTGDTEEIYKEFFISVYETWQSLAGQFNILDPYLLASILEGYGDIKIADNTKHGANARIIEEIEEKWLKRTPDNPITSDDCINISQDKTKVKRMTLQYHPDKNPKYAELAVTEENGKLFYNKISEILRKLGEAANEAENVAPVKIKPQAIHGVGKKSHTITHEKQQLQDMPDVISCYQTWFTGANNYIVDLKDPELDEDVYAELCGDKSSKVNLLFSALDFASKHDTNLRRSPTGIEELDGDFESKSPEPEYIETHEQTQRRQKLFATLTKIFATYPSSYVISAETWAKIIDRLAKSTDEHLVENYPAWLETFFKALGDKKPINLESKDEVRRISRIFEMMFNIYDTVFIEKQGKKYVSEDFTTDVVELLLNRYASEFNEELITITESFFTKNEDVGKLLLLESNRADIVRTLDTIAENKDADNLQTKFDGFIEYIEDNIDKLKAQPACIRPAFELFVNTEPKESEEHYVPPMASLSDLMHEEQKEETIQKLSLAKNRKNKLYTKSRVNNATKFKKNNIDNQAVFLSFLSQRPGYSEDIYNNFMKIFSAGNAGKIIAGLATLPPYISIDFIEQHLSSTPGKHDVGQFDEKIKSIRNAAQSFNEFLYKRSVIEAVDAYKKPLNEDAYNAWTQSLLTTSLSKSQSFFSIAKDCYEISDEIMLRVFNDYIDESIPDDNHLRAVVEVLQETQAFPTLQMDLYLILKATQISEDVKADLINYLRLLKAIPSNYLYLFKDQLSKIAQMDESNIKKNLPAIIYFAKAFNDKKFIGFTDEDLPILNTSWIDNFDIDWLNKHLEIADGLAKYESRTNKWTVFHNIYKANFANQELLDKLNKILKVFNEAKDLPPNNSHQLFIDAYFAEKIPTSEALHQALNIYQKLSVDKFARTELRAMFFTALSERNINQEMLNQFSMFIDMLSKEPLELAVINMLSSNFFDKTQEDLKIAIKTVTFAQKINGNERLFKQCFANLDNCVDDRIALMRFIHHGLLDFLGQSFKAKCIESHNKLFASSTIDRPDNINPDRTSFKAKLHKWCSNISKVMYEILEIMRAGVNGGAAYQTKHNFTSNVIQHKLSFRQYEDKYQGFWYTTNRNRRIEAKSFFYTINNYNDTRGVSNYYLDVLKQIHLTQNKIVNDDIRNNRTRWFTNLNSKGYSRFYDITMAIKGEILQSYHTAVLSGNVSPNEYIEFQNELKLQVKTNCCSLRNLLPADNILFRSLNNCLVNSYNDHEILISSLKQITTLKEENVPKHLRHLVENLITSVQLADSSVLPKSSVSMTLSN